MADVQKKFNESIPKFTHVVVEIICLTPMRENYPLLFTPKWLSDGSRVLMSTILKNAAAELNDIEQQGVIINIIHYRMLVKDCMEYLVNAYFEKFIWTVRFLYKMTGGWKPTIIDEGYAEKMLTQEGVDFKAVFQVSKVQLS